MDPVAAIAHCFQSLGWSSLPSDQLAIDLQQFDRHACLLRQSLAKNHSISNWLTESGRLDLEQLVALGLSVRLNWPRPWSQAIEGIRSGLFAGHCRIFESGQPLVSIVSSRLGRGNRLLPDWPRWIEFSLKTLSSERGRLLVAPETPTYPMVTKYMQFVGVPVIPLRTVSLAKKGDALAHTIRSLLADDPSEPKRTDELWYFHNEGEHSIDAIPIHDRLHVLLPDQVFALAARKGGNIERLLHQRITTTDIPVGSTFVAVDRRGKGTVARLKDWLDAGAVGWYLHPPTTHTDCRATYCRSARSVTASVQQLTSPIAASKLLTERCEDGFVVHCTRGEQPTSFTKVDGNDGLGDQHWQKSIMAGSELCASPFAVLLKICQEQRLVSTSTWTRDGSSVVSFTSKPLLEVLSGRKFQSHLGRWDWEPYGILIRRSALQTLGGGPVIYGDQSTFEQLPPDQRPFFQLAKRRKSVRHSDWIDEQEWRSLGDVKLSDLSLENVGVFVATRREALALARHCKWPIYWLRDS